jgi:hypothetical protein
VPLIYLGRRRHPWFSPCFCLPALAFLAFFGRSQRQIEERDSRTSTLPSSCSAMAERVTVMPPCSLWPFSNVTTEELQGLVSEGLLHPCSVGPRPKWIAPGDEDEPTPPAGYVVSFIPFHERGFRVLASRFMRALPHYYGVELHNFNPNSIAQAAIYVVVFEGTSGSTLTGTCGSTSSAQSHSPCRQR